MLPLQHSGTMDTKGFGTKSDGKRGRRVAQESLAIFLKDLIFTLELAYWDLGFVLVATFISHAIFMC